MKTLEAHKDPHKEVSNKLLFVWGYDKILQNEIAMCMSIKCLTNQLDLTEEVIRVINKHSALAS